MGRKKGGGARHGKGKRVFRLFEQAGGLEKKKRPLIGVFS